MFRLFDEEDPGLEEKVLVEPESPERLHLKVLEYVVERLTEREGAR